MQALKEAAETDISFDRDWWRTGMELGWTALAVPDELGGGSVSGGPTSDQILIAQEIGRHCAPGPFVAANAAVAALSDCESPPEELLHDIIAGEMIAVWGEGGDLRYDADNYTVSGEIDIVESAQHADFLVLDLENPSGPAAIVIDSQAPGVAITEAWSLDPGRSVARVTLDRVALDPSHVLTFTGAGNLTMPRHKILASVLASAESFGAAERMFEVTREWMGERRSFGRSLSSYQALKHRMADNLTWIYACHAIVLEASNRLDLRLETAAEFSSAAKSYVGGKSVQMMQDFVQLHGGIGVTWEHELHFYLRRCLMNNYLYGTPEEHRDALVSILEEKS